MARYRMSWASDDGHRCKLEIVGGTGSEWVELTPGRNPFITMEDTDSNPYTPVRTDSAKISFIVDGNFNINVQKGNQYNVYMYKENDDEEMILRWRGYLNAETYSQRFSGDKKEVTINASGVVATLSAWSLNKSRSYDMVSLHELICECLAHVDNQQYDIIFPNDTRAQKTAYTGISLLYLKVNEFNFFHNSESTEEEGSGITADDCLTVIRKICTYFGWTFRANDMCFYFESFGCEDYCKRMTFSEFTRGIFTQSTEQAEEAAELTPYGNNNMISVEHGKSRIEISIAENNEDKNESLPKVTTEDSTYVGEVVFEDEGSFMTQSKTKCLMYQSESENMIFRNLSIDKVGNIQEIIPYAGGQIPEKGASVNIVRYDKSVLRTDGSYDPEKKNFDYKEGVLFHIKHGEGHMPNLNEDRLDNHPALTIMQQKPINVNGGAFIFNASKVFIETMHDGIIRLASLKVSIKVGNKYWNGTQWSEGKSILKLGMDDAGNSTWSVHNTKTLDMPFTGNGYVMPVIGSMSGYVEIAFYYDYWGNNISQDIHYEVSDYVLGSVNLEYVENDNADVYKKKDKDKKFVKQINGWKEDVVSVDLDLCSGNENSKNYGVLYDGLSILKQVSYNGVIMKPEEALLKKHETHFCVSRNVLTITAEHPDHTDPLHYFTIEGKKYMAISTNNVNWRTNTCELILKDYD